MTWLYYLIPFAAVAVAVALIRRDTTSLRQVLAEADERRRRLTPAASPLGAAMERIVPAAPISSAAMAVIQCAEHAPVHPRARPNGRDLADRLRLECPWLTDAQGAEICASLIVYAGDQRAGAPRGSWLVLTDALTFAAVEFASLECATEGGEL